MMTALVGVCGPLSICTAYGLRAHESLVAPLAMAICAPNFCACV
jgi:hypothetical protein